MREHNPDGDPDLARVVVEGIEPGIEWIKSLGVAVAEPITVLGYGRGCETDLAAFISTCAAMVRKSGTLLTSATTERLLQDERGVHGAVVRVGDHEITINATATLLATGGFGGSPDLRVEHIHELAREMPLRAQRHSTGDGLRLGLSAGAAFAGEGAGFYGHLIPSHVAYREPSEFIALTFYHSEHGILVNRGGDRFCDETLGDHLNTLEVLDQADARALLICDERVHREWMLKPYVEGAEATDKFRLAYERGAHAAIAEDPEELEALPPEWGYDGEAVRDTLIAFNEASANGTPEPGRKLDSKPLLDPPYYVIEVIPAIT